MELLREDSSFKFLLNASLLYQEKCPELSRYLLQWPLKGNDPPKKTFSGLIENICVCPHCYQWLKPDNHHIRLWPKRRPSARVQSILLRKARGKRLSLVQKNLLLRFQKSSSVVMATCHTCTKTSRHKGMNRDFIATFAKTPQSGKRSGMTTPKTPGKNKTPAHTPRSSISSSISASSSTSSTSSSKPKNWVVQRLSKILLREDNQGSKKGGLKDFLSSL